MQRIRPLLAALVLVGAGTAAQAGADMATAAGDQAIPPPASGPIVPRVEPLERQPFTLDDRYLDAARRGDLPTLKLCLEKGATAATKDALGRSALLLSVSDARSLEMATFLAERGLPIDESDVSGRTPLSYAAGNGDSAIVAYLLARGAKTDHRDAQGQSPLFNAALMGRKDVVERLIAAGADVNVQDRFGDTPLMGACNKSFEDVAMLLVAKGANPQLTDQEGRTARERAAPSADFCRELKTSP